jgi:hypothetical protein
MNVSNARLSATPLRLVTRSDIVLEAVAAALRERRRRAGTSRRPTTTAVRRASATTAATNMIVDAQWPKAAKLRTRLHRPCMASRTRCVHISAGGCAANNHHGASTSPRQQSRSRVGRLPMRYPGSLRRTLTSRCRPQLGATGSLVARGRHSRAAAAAGTGLRPRVQRRKFAGGRPSTPRRTGAAAATLRRLIQRYLR